MKRKIKCDCGHELRLVVTEKHQTTYTINRDGSLEHYDGDCDGREFKLICTECDDTYEFKQGDYIELEDRPQLFIRWFRDRASSGEQIKQNINELEIVKVPIIYKNSIEPAPPVARIIKEGFIKIQRQ